MCLLVCCATVCRLAELVFAAVHVFFVRIYVDYLVLVVSAVCVSEICMHNVCGDLYAGCMWGTCMHDACGGLVCIMCVGDLYA